MFLMLFFITITYTAFSKTTRKDKAKNHFPFLIFSYSIEVGAICKSNRKSSKKPKQNG